MLAIFGTEISVRLLRVKIADLCVLHEGMPNRVGTSQSVKRRAIPCEMAPSSTGRPGYGLPVSRKNSPILMEGTGGAFTPTSSPFRMPRLLFN